MSSGLSVAGNTTVIGGGASDFGSNDWHLDEVHGRSSKRSPVTETAGISASSKHPRVLFATQDNYNLDEGRPFFVKIERDGVLAALKKLDGQLKSWNGRRILSKKNPTDWIGREIAPGQIGFINHGGMPKVLTKPGRYPGFPLRNWWAREWNGTKGISDTVVEFLGLIVVQVSQNQAAVISDPNNRIFVVKNGGFAALSIEGAYEVLAVVDQTHLPNAVKDRVTGATLGWSHEVRMRSRTGSGKEQEYVVALFLNIPANNCAILQRGDDLELLPAGQHYITNPNVTLRGLFTLGENQLEMPTKDIFTRDQVPVSLTIYLKWQLTEPLKLTTHGYNTPFDALRDKTQSILTQIVAHLDYSSMVKQRSLGPDNLDSGDDASSAFLDALRTRAMDEMHIAALEYGIVLKDLAVIDRQFKGEIAATMDKLTTRALQAQVEAANVDRENSNKVKQEEGALSVTKIKAQALNTKADADAYQVVASARAAAKSTQIAAEAQAEATLLAARAEADAIRLRAVADAEVRDTFAREMQLRRIDVSRIAAYGNRTVFVPVGNGTGENGHLAEQAGNAMAVGYAAGLGAEHSKH
ncbi:band 7 domain-containing protein [Fomitiporia mediterranea MF3/22]|uniref:band 7 domain-containing protein n=1 Tax=Fomitiporia mediterranea (strain MF3/22) TaxID=694068 RepID=UPI0004408479|nr:band 7 domain-containing protein [Fomitiporia mediterranea MF3/22]EJD06172.1 band 7 domain-containing protein [Fomitiporia mediterranea MF3/22]